MIFTILAGWMSMVGAMGQESGESQDKSLGFQAWTDFNPSWAISDKLSFKGEIGARTVIDGNWNRFYARPTLILRRKSTRERPQGLRLWEGHAGMGLFHTEHQGPLDFTEIRPHQGIRLTIPYGDRFSLRHYFRLEERFFFLSGSPHNQFSLRFRYMIAGNLQLAADGLLPGFFVPFNTELLINLPEGGKTDKVIRISPGLGYAPGERWRIAFFMMYHRSLYTRSEWIEVNDLAGRIRLWWRINE